MSDDIQSNLMSKSIIQCLTHLSPSVSTLKKMSSSVLPLKKMFYVSSANSRIVVLIPSDIPLMWNRDSEGRMTEL